MFDPVLHHRRSIRLQEYDYSKAGLYFVTICTHNREKLFGYIENKKMKLNDAGKMVDRIYNELINYHNMEIDKYIIMPDHFHGIIKILVGADSISAQSDDTIRIDDANTAKNDKSNFAQTHGPMQNTEYMTAHDTEHISNDKIRAIHNDKKWATDTDGGLSNIIQTFKRYTTIEYIKMVKKNILPPFNKRIWQRNYYEHIIRTNESLKKITEYILTNPGKWSEIDEHEI